jgi:hypothetical protein
MKIYITWSLGAKETFAPMGDIQPENAENVTVLLVCLHKDHKNWRNTESWLWIPLENGHLGDRGGK